MEIYMDLNWKPSDNWPEARPLTTKADEKEK